MIMGDAAGFHQKIAERQQDVFRVWVGQGRRFSYPALSAATEIPAKTLASYAAGTAMPLHNLLRLLRALPPEAGSMLIEESGYRLAPIDSRASNWDAVSAATAGFTAEVCQARADGRIDHREEAELASHARSVIAQLQAVVDDSG